MAEPINTVFPEPGYQLRGLTLHRPWAWAFTDADKRVENRPQRPPKGMLGQWVALHSGLHFDQDAARRMRGGYFGEAARGCPVTDANCPPRMITAIAGVRGFFEVVAAVAANDGNWSGFMHKDTGELVLDPWKFGPIVIDTPYIVKLPTPVPCETGSLGWWRLPADVEAAVREQVEIAKGAHHATNS